MNDSRSQNEPNSASAANPHGDDSEMLAAGAKTIEKGDPTFIVGVGASAGGLEALEQFFANVAPDTRLAFIVIQHLSPNFKSMMSELLSRKTILPIHAAAHDMTVRAGCIYLLPPRKEMIMSDGRLLVTDKDPSEDFFLPIDHFFRSLGQDQRGKSIGIVLSGTGSDGSRGIEHIHRGGGLVMAQSEDTAGFDGMPRSAQNTGLVDLVLPPAEMPRVLQQYCDDPSSWRDHQQVGGVSPSRRTAMQGIIQLLRQEFEIDFTLYKEDMIGRRVQRRLLIVDCGDIEGYLKLLKEDPDELCSLYRDILIGVTGFFRDVEAYQQFADVLLPKLVERLEPSDELRIWVAATASGEEAYSIAIIVDEYFTSRRLPVRCRIFATDVHQTSLEFASRGLYSESKVKNISAERLERYFRREANGYRIAPEIRQHVVFASHNVISDAPFTKLNLVSCRNLFIYLKPEVQRRVLSLFHFGLRVGGGLWLGSSEVPSELEQEFEAVDAHWKLYIKHRDVRLTKRPRAPQTVRGVNLREPSANAGVRKNSETFEVYDQILHRYIPPAILVTENRELLHTFGGAGQYISAVDGRATSDICDQLDASVRVPFETAIRKAKRENTVVEYGGIVYPTAEGPRHLQLNVVPIKERNATLFLVEFKLGDDEVPERTAIQVDLVAESSGQVQSLETELSYVRQNLSATIEELQASNEEMQSTNEELVASNEELQSTNEELHSVNEELYTVNAEYQRKIVELTELTDDMDNLLNSTHVDTIFLDRDLRVRKFTPKVAEKFNLLRQDIGRNFESFTYRLDDDHLLDELRRVLNTEEAFEREVSDRQSRVYLMRILPYLSRGNVEGVVLTLVDITSLKIAQNRLADLSEIVQQSADAIFRVDVNGCIRTWNDGAKRLYGQDDSLIGQHISDLFPVSTHRELATAIDQLSEERRVQRINTHYMEIGDKRTYISASLSPVFDANDTFVAASVVARDITDRVESEAQVNESIQRRDQFLAMLSHELRNPLGAILNAARIIGAADDGELIRRSSDIVVRQSYQMSRLLDDLLDVSRVTLGKIELRREVMELGETLAEAVHVIHDSFAQDKIEFHYSECNEPLYVDGDPARLQQVVVNLLRNAVKYTPQGGRVDLVALMSRGEAEIRVRDTGVGIEESMLERIFDVFVQVNSSIERSQGGIGLGLTLVKAVVEMHGGTVELFSGGIGCGSEFRVRLPLCEVAPEPKRLAHAKNDMKRIVLVEDIHDAREMAAELLRLQGFDVSAASDGESGLELIQKVLPDLSLIDIGLPEIDGYEVARRLRADPKTKSLHLIALTGYGQSSDRHAVEEAGFDDHLVKPLDLGSLEQLLSTRRKEATLQREGDSE